VVSFRSDWADKPEAVKTVLKIKINNFVVFISVPELIIWLREIKLFKIIKKEEVNQEN
jgi:hypothetical protein